jgi:integrase
MARHITELGLRALKPRDRRYEKPIGRGLSVIVQPSGAKSFAVRYRFGGRTRKLTLSGGLSLAAAHRATADALYKVEQGIDPAVIRAQQKQKQRLADADTFAAVVNEFFRREGKTLRSAKRRRSTFDRLVIPVLGDRPIGEIKRSEIVRLLDKVEEESGPSAADDVLAFIRKLMNWHATRSDEFRSPIIRGMARTKPTERARTRILSDGELRAVWTTAAGQSGPFPVLIRFLILTAARRTEARAMAWTEIDGADWTLPAARNKTKVDLVRPLSDATLALLREVPRVDGGPFVFSNNGRRPIGGLARLKKKFDKACGVTGWALHDLRRTARSLLSCANISPDHAERCLGHVIGGVRGVYDRHEYHAEKAQAYEALAAQIDRIIHPVDNVAEFSAHVGQIVSGKPAKKLGGQAQEKSRGRCRSQDQANKGGDRRATSPLGSETA